MNGFYSVRCTIENKSQALATSESMRSMLSYMLFLLRVSLKHSAPMYALHQLQPRDLSNLHSVRRSSPEQTPKRAFGGAQIESTGVYAQRTLKMRLKV
eukprot:607536-Amphidinium_carterae.2